MDTRLDDGTRLARYQANHDRGARNTATASDLMDLWPKSLEARALKPSRNGRILRSLECMIGSGLWGLGFRMSPEPKKEGIKGPGAGSNRFLSGLPWYLWHGSPQKVSSEDLLAPTLKPEAPSPKHIKPPQLS